MGKFEQALKKSTSKRNNEKPKDKHLATLSFAFEELPFPETASLLLKLLSHKRMNARLRTLIVLHHLLSQNKTPLLTWLQTSTIHIEVHKHDNFMPLFPPYYNYLKLKSKTITTQAFFSDPSNLQRIKISSNHLFQQIEELMALMQAIIDIKKPLGKLIKMNPGCSLFIDICTRLFADSQPVYLALKSSVGELWAIFKEFEAYKASRAQRVFLQYNEIVRNLKKFIDKFPEKYPGQVPKFNLLNESSLKEVNDIVRGKENVNTCPNLLNFEAINQDGSPVKPKKEHSASPEKLNSAANFQTQPSRQSLPWMGGYPLFMYPTSLPYQQCLYYNPYNPNK